MDFIARKIDGEMYVSLDQVNKAIEEKNAEIENIKSSHYAEMVDAGMRERRLRRALYKACANWADVEVFERTVGIDDPNIEANRWALMRNKCLKKAEEYK
jgi:hypothetical protein